MVTVIGTATVDLLASGVSELPAGRGDEFEEQTLVTLRRPPNVTIGGNGGNCAYVLRRLGIAARLVSPMGDDLFGRIAVGWLDDAGVILDRIEPRVTSVNFVATTIDGDRASFFFPAEPHTDDLVRLAEDAVLDEGDHLHLAGFPHPSSMAMSAWLNAAGDGVTTSLDIGPPLTRFRLEDIEDLLPHLTWLMGNEREIAALAGGAERSIAATRSRVRSGVVVKRGRNGVTVIASDDRFDLSAPKVEAGTTVGAGDAFDAGFLAALMRGDHPEDAAAFGQEVARVVLDRGQGVLAAPTMDEIEARRPADVRDRR